MLVAVLGTPLLGNVIRIGALGMGKWQIQRMEDAILCAPHLVGFRRVVDTAPLGGAKLSVSD